MNDRVDAAAPSGEGEGRPPAFVSNLPGIAYRRRNDHQQTIEFVTEGISRITGYTTADFASGRIHWVQLVDPDDRDQAWEAAQSAVRENRPYQLEYRIHHKDGSLRWLWDQGQGMLAEGNELLALQGFVTDVTERKRGEAALAEAKQRLEAHMDNSPLAVIEFDAQFRIARWSAEAERLFGWTAGEVLGRTVSDLRWVHEDDGDSVRRVVADMLSGERPRTKNVNRNYRKDGRVVYCEWYNSAIYDSQGRLTSILSQVLDITERKAAEENLRSSQAQLRSFIRHAPISIAMFDRNMNYLATSGRWLAEHGRGHVDLVGLNHYQVLPDMPPEWKQIHQQGLSGATVKNDEDLWIQADGSPMWLRWVVQPWLDENGAIGGIIISFEDITEYKRTEEALRRQVELNRYYLDTVQTVIVALDREGRITMINRKGCETLGYTEVELLGRNWFESCLPQPEGMAAVYPVFREMMAGQLDPFEYFENPICCRDGSPRLIAWHNACLTSVDGGFVGTLSSGEDITERKRAELALRDSEHRLAGIVSSAMDAIISVDQQQCIRLFNPAAEQMFGLTAEEAIGQPVSRLIPERCRLAHEGHIGRFGQTATTARRIGALGMLNGLRSSGEEFPAEASISQIEVGGEKVFTVILRDITERMKAESELRESRDRLALALQAAKAGYWDWDLTSGRAACGTECYSLWGVEQGRERLDEWMEVVHPEDLKRVNRGWREAGAGGRGLNLEFRVNHPNLGTRWLMVVGRTLRDTAGHPVRVSGLSIDITERKRAEEALRASQADLTRAQAVGHIGSWRLNMRSNEVTWSAENYRIFGIPDGMPLTYETFLAAVHPDDRDDVDRQWQAGLRGEPYDIEHRLIVDGKVKWVRERAELEFDQDGALLGGFGTTQDITERKEAEEALREADRRKDAFLATLAHELRNPLAPIRNAAEILRIKGLPDPTSRAARDMIERQLQHMVRLVDDLMDVSRITRGRLLLRREHLDLSAVLGHAIASSRHHVQCAGHELTWAPPPQPIALDADPVRLEQVFVNLLHNACKFTGVGGHIRVTAEQDGTDFVVVKVSDTGIGIPPEHMPHLFDMFAQVGSTPEQPQGGLGIGLALSRGLVEMHGGSIEARSEGSGKGTEFRVCLPILSGGPESPSPLLQDDSYDVKPVAARRVLVVDDSPDVAESLAMFLQVTGYEVETADDGLAAVESAARFRPDLVLLDIGMPGLDGYAACRRMREHPWGKDMVIVALTGWGQESDRRKTRAAGFDGHLVKPVDPPTLQQLLGDPRAWEG